MADVVKFGDRLEAKQRAHTKYFERMDLTAKMIPVMIDAVEKMQAMGADREHLIQFFQATIEELRDSG